MTSSGRGQIDKAVNCRCPKRRPIGPRCQRTNSATALPGEPGARAAKFNREADIWTERPEKGLCGTKRSFRARGFASDLRRARLCLNSSKQPNL